MSATLSINSLRQAEIAEAKKKLITNTQPKSNVVPNSNANATPVNTDYSALIAKRAAEGASSTELGEYERLRNDKISSQGLSYEKTYNYNKSPAPERPEVNNTFDTNALYQAQLAARKAENEALYNTTLNTLNKNYDTNLLGYQNQQVKMQNDYEDSVTGIKQNTYNDIESGKVNAANRGIMNSAMGLGMSQASKRQGSDNINTATQQRNDFLNEINAQINNLTKGYGSDVLTAQTNYGLSNIQATNEALSSKLTADLDMWKQKDAQVFERQLQQAGFTQEELMLDKKFRNDVEMFGYTSALQIKLQQISEAGANSRANLSASLARDQFIYSKEQDILDRQDASNANKFNFYTNIPGYDPTDTLGLFSGTWTKSGQNVEITKEKMKASGFKESEIDSIVNQYYSSTARKLGTTFNQFLEFLFAPK